MEHVNSKINLILHNKNEAKEINNKNIQIEVENLEILQCNNNFSFKNNVSNQSLVKVSNDNDFIKSKTCRITLDITIKQSSNHRLSERNINSYLKGITL